MRIATLREKYDSQYKNKIKLIRKGYFRIALNEEAFFMAKYYNMKITKLDKQNIKIGFPEASYQARIQRLETKNIGYIALDKGESEDGFIIKAIGNGDYFNKIFQFDIESYELTKQRILGLAKLGLEEKVTKNFLLKDKVEELYVLLMTRLVKMPKRERFFFREKVERLFMDLLQNIYSYMYNIGNRALLIKAIFDEALLIREFTRLLYKLGRINNENVFLDIGARRVEILKICKGLQNKFSVA